jgi:hypothetical protein
MWSYHLPLSVHSIFIRRTHEGALSNQDDCVVGKENHTKGVKINAALSHWHILRRRAVPYSHCWFGTARIFFSLKSRAAQNWALRLRFRHELLKPRHVCLTKGSLEMEAIFIRHQNVTLGFSFTPRRHLCSQNLYSMAARIFCSLRHTHIELIKPLLN